MGVDSVFETDVLRSLIAQIEAVDRHPLRDPGQTGARLQSHRRPPPLPRLCHCRRGPAKQCRPRLCPAKSSPPRCTVRPHARAGPPLPGRHSPALVSTMGADYPELVKGEERIAEILTVEEEASSAPFAAEGIFLTRSSKKRKAPLS